MTRLGEVLAKLPRWVQIVGGLVVAYIVVVYSLAAVGVDLEGDQSKPRPAAGTPRPAPPPQPTEKAPKRTGRASPSATQADKRFFLALDNDAVALDAAIGGALDEIIDGQRGGGRQATTRIFKRMKRRTDSRLLKTGDDSKGANELVSAASDASLSADSGNARGLVKARVAAQQARLAFNGEFIGPDSEP